MSILRKLTFVGAAARLRRARSLKRELHALYLAVRDARTPWFAKALAAGIVIYVISPVDIIPDFIPVIGKLDDAILIPAGFFIVRRLIPRDVMADCSVRAAGRSGP